MLWSLSAELSESVPWHTHAVFEFMIFKKAGCAIVGESGVIAGEPERTILIPPSLRHRYQMDDGARVPCKLICITRDDALAHLSPAHSALLDKLCAAGISFADHPDAAVSIDNLAGMILDGFDSGDVVAQRVSWSAFGLLLALHAKELERRSGQYDRTTAFRYCKQVKAVAAWIDRHPCEDFTLDQAASRFGLSRSLLTREFRRHTGRSLVEYINARRVENAAIALVTRPDSVTDVAYMNGFSNLSHFHRQFKAHYGLTPASFRRKVIEEGGAKVELGASSGQPG